jgi:hypothetical protein
MKRATVCALLVLCVTGPEALPQEKPGKGKAVAARAKWEYSVLTRDEVRKRGKGDLAAGLNALGEEGWEMVALGAGTTNPAGRGARPAADYYFKRPKQAEKAAPASAAKEEMTKVFRLKHARAATVAKIVDKLHGQKMGRLAADERTNSLVAAGTAEQLIELANLILALDEAHDGAEQGGKGGKK